MEILCPDSGARMYIVGMNAREAALYVTRTLHTAGFEAYLVGGCVRDELISRFPKDYDVTTSAHPEQVVSLFPKTFPKGADFGVVSVMVERHEIEVTTFRADGQYTDGRRPDEVRYSESARDDVARRDFTINGLLLMPCLWGDDIPQSLIDKLEAIEKADQEGRQADLGEDTPYSEYPIWELHDGRYALVDYVHGKDDIDAKVIRCIGDPRQRFTEDKLRMLRAVRFAAQLGFTVEKETKAAILELAAGIKLVSRERIREELSKLLTAPFAVQGISLLFSTGLARHIFDHAAGLNVADILERFERFPTLSTTTAWGMFLAACEAEVVEEILNSLKLPNAELEGIRGAALHQDEVLRIHRLGGEGQRLTGAYVKRLLRQKGFRSAVELVEQKAVMEGRDSFLATAQTLRAFTDEEIHPKPLVTGDDLIAAGLQPGSVFKVILHQIEDAQLNGVVNTREQALSQMQSVLESINKVGI